MKRNNRPSPIVTRPRALPASAARRIAPSFRLARERFGELNVDVEGALAMLSAIPISLHCWQGDDVRGFENANSALGGGLAVTGNYPGRARTAEELRMDLEQALSLIPGRHRVNLHAIYGEFGVRKVERTEIEPEHYGNWVRWAGEHGLGLDFNPTCFAHPQAADGLTLSHPDKRIRRFWIEHCIAARHVGSAMGIGLENPCVTNLWIPDGFKDTPADRVAPRERLMESLDEIFRQPLRYNLDAVEPKLFGIGAESCTVGSHEFYLGYAITRKKLLCLDAGHFHPTESIADKISSVLPFLPAILLHVSRGVRWDSDHVVTQTDDLLAIAREVVANDPTCRRPVARPAQAKRRKEAGGAPRRIHIGLDYFDASINRIAAWVIGARNVQRALLTALLEPPAIRESERSGDNTARLALQEEARSLPVGAVWDFFCESQGVPVGEGWLQPVKHYEQRILSTRD